MGNKILPLNNNFSFQKIMRTVSFFIFLFSFLIYTYPAHAQKKGDHLIIEKINGVKYYIHSVEKGNTLYSIAKKYGVSVEEITKSNPETASGLKIGQTIKIPVNKASIKEDREIRPVMQGDYLIHEVMAKETMYSISKKYNIKVKDIIDINPETATKDLSIGQKLKIPLLKSQEVKPADILPATGDSVLTKEKPANDSISKAAIVLKEHYNVTFVLPLFTEINDSIDRHLKFNEKAYIYEESEVALRFYEGALIALDSLKKTNTNFLVTIFDTADDSTTVSELLAKPSVKNSDIIIGPFYQYLFKDIALFAKQNQIGIACPVPQSAKILLENKYASKVPASPLVQSDQLAEFLNMNKPGKKILVFGSTEKNDMRLCQAFLDKFRELSENSNRDFSSVVSDYYFAEINIEKIKPVLSLSDTNYIVIPSHNQAFVSDLLTKLNSIAEKYRFVIYGLDKLAEFENIDIKYLHQLNVHIASPFYIDPDASNVENFIDKFREKFKTEPGKYGFLGFDVTYYYLTALHKYGKSFYDYLPEYKTELLSTSFDFVKTGYESGCENKHVYILKYENFKLVKVN